MIGSELRKDLSSYISAISLPESAPNWGAMTASFYDRIFGKKFVSIRFLLISVSISVVTFLAINVTLSVINNELYNEAAAIAFLEEQQALRAESNMGTWAAFGYLFVSILVLNGFADYFSNIETRVLTKLWDEGRISSLSVLVFDLVLTALIFCVCFAATGLIIDIIELILGLSEFNWKFYKRLLWPIYEAVNLGDGDILLASAFFTTFTTSIWIWSIVFLSETSIFRNQTHLGRYLGYFLPVSERPIRSVGILFALVVLLFTILS